MNSTKMNLGVFRPTRLPLSVERYIASTCRELGALGISTTVFSEVDPMPHDVNLYWDPGVGRPAPHAMFRAVKPPLVVTYHGAANVSLAFGECFEPGLRSFLGGALSRARTLKGWRVFEGHQFKVIAVSNYAAAELKQFLPVVPSNIITIHHGVDHEVFNPGESWNSDRAPYFLHVSSYQPKKNVDRLFAAYARLDPIAKPRMVAVTPGYHGRSIPQGVELINEPLDHHGLASLYRDAIGFVFPSLHETFGMPILEAMASGCPVITACDTACAETAGDAALLVDPRSVDEIAEAMRRLVADTSLRDALRRKGLVRAKSFTWRKCAEQHLAVFEDAVRRKTAA